MVQFHPSAQNNVIMANRLPKYYIVFADLKNPLWYGYIEHLNSLYGMRFDPNACIEKHWYGFDGSAYWGVCGYQELSYFINNPTVLTLEEFFDLKKEVEPSIIKVTSTHKETVKSVDIHIEIEGSSEIEFLYDALGNLKLEISGRWDDRVIELLDGIKSQLKG